jgi:hypothetical protein
MARHQMRRRKVASVKKRRFKPIVCKPCWELKYCPYGSLVEFFPQPGPELSMRAVRKRYKDWLDAVRDGELKTEAEIFRAIEAILCLSPDRWSWIEGIRYEELSCSVFGHVCPVFFEAEPFTETHEGRRTSRTIPREVMLQVVRRDGPACRMCRRNVRDNEVEFDHIIPHSKGGPTTTENLRLLCRDCNRKKRDSLKEVVSDDPLWGERRRRLKNRLQWTVARGAAEPER